MSKVFDALREAELAIAERKRAETAAALLIKDICAHTDSSGQGSAPNLAVQSPNTNSLPADILNHDTKTGGVAEIMAGLLAVVAPPPREAEAPQPKRSEVGAAPLTECTCAHTGSTGQGSAPNLAVQSPNTNSLPAESRNHDTKTGGVAKIMAGMRAVVTRPRPKAEAPQPISIFGDLGQSLESAAKSSFWQWFYLAQTREENGVHRFQPSGTQFQSLCYLDVAVSAEKDMQALTLGVQRAFIDGEHEPFARDLVKSFLCTVLLQQKSEPVNQLVDELGTEFSGAWPVMAAEGARREAPITRASPLYLVFTGLGKRCATESGAFNLEMQNVTDGSTQWFCLRVRLGPPLKQKRSGNGAH
jgi:hypothetical protein